MTAVQRIGDSIWLAEGGWVNFFGFAYPTRMVIVRLANTLLWVWSPIALSANLRAEVDELGRVAHLVSPNRIHHLFLKDWQAVYPAAKLWGPASTIRKRPDLAFQDPLTDTPPIDWQNEIDQFCFTGSPIFDEVVFLHRRSRTAILADLSENFSAGFLDTYWAGWQRRMARVWKIVEPHGLPPLELRLSWMRRKEARLARDRLLAAEPQQVVMAHGEWQRTDGRAYLERVFGWLG